MRKSEKGSTDDFDEWASGGEPDVERERRERGLRAEIRDLKRSNKAIHESLDRAERRLDLALAIKKQDLTKNTFKIRIPKHKENHAIPVMIGSDWHLEEKIEPETIAGRNEYNLEIAQESARAFFTNGLALIQRMRVGDKKLGVSKVNVDRIICGFLGDMIHNTLVDEMLEDNQLSPIEAIELFQQVAYSGINYLLDKADVEELIIPCCHGNHGRTTRKRRIATGAKNSYEWLAYRNLQQRFEGDKRVKFVITEGSHLYLDLKEYGWDYTIRFHHGDDVRYYGGVGGLSVPMRKACAEWDTFKKADLTVVGHWHQLVDFGWSIVNGSLCGFNAYSLHIKARFEPPRQAFFMLDREHGKTIVAPIKIR